MSKIETAIAEFITEHRVNLAQERELVSRHEAHCERLEEVIAQLEELQAIAAQEAATPKAKAHAKA
jgi:hypothetical protein